MRASFPVPNHIVVIRCFEVLNTDCKLKLKIIDMLMYMDDRLKDFPREQRQALALQIRKTGYDMLALSDNIATGYFNATIVSALDKKNGEMKVYIEYAMNRKHISSHQYKVWLGFCVEIGKMVGAMKKTIADRKNQRTTGNKP